MTDDDPTPCIYVIAGTNGAGKSSLQGGRLLRLGTPHFDPDQAARRIRRANPWISQSEANSAAWHEGRRLLETAIRETLSFAFETTLGGRTITALLEAGLRSGMEVRVWYVGLASPELHIQRVRSRVAAGGHDIPDAKIRERYNRSRLNLIQLLPRLIELQIFDNSNDADPRQGTITEPRHILHVLRGRIESSCELSLTPEWAKPLVAAALRSSE